MKSPIFVPKIRTTMESKNSSLAILHEPFVAGMDENLSPIMQRLWKLEGVPSIFAEADGHTSQST